MGVGRNRADGVEAKTFRVSSRSSQLKCWCVVLGGLLLPLKTIGKNRIRKRAVLKTLLAVFNQGFCLSGSPSGDDERRLCYPP